MKKIIIVLLLAFVSFLKAEEVKAQKLFEFQTFSPSQFDSLNWKQRIFYSFAQTPIEKYDFSIVQWSIDTNSIYFIRQYDSILFKLNNKVHLFKFKFAYDDMKHLVRYKEGYKIEFITDNHCGRNELCEWADWNRICVTYKKKRICKKIYYDVK